jgi:hypothetical protein
MSWLVDLNVPHDEERAQELCEHGHWTSAQLLKHVRKKLTDSNGAVFFEHRQCLSAVLMIAGSSRRTRVIVRAHGSILCVSALQCVTSRQQQQNVTIRRKSYHPVMARGGAICPLIAPPVGRHKVPGQLSAPVVSGARVRRCGTRTQRSNPSAASTCSMLHLRRAAGGGTRPFQGRRQSPGAARRKVRGRYVRLHVAGTSGAACRRWRRSGRVAQTVRIFLTARTRAGRAARAPAATALRGRRRAGKGGHTRRRSRCRTGGPCGLRARRGWHAGPWFEAMSSEEQGWGSTESGGTERREWNGGSQGRRHIKPASPVPRP